MASKKRVYDPTELEISRWLYEYTDTPVAAIARRLRCSKSTFHALVKERGWRPRLQRAAGLASAPSADAAPIAAPAPAAAAPLDALEPAEPTPPAEALAIFNAALEEEAAAAAADAPAAGTGAATDLAGIAANLGDMIESEIGRLRMMQSAGGFAASERIARTVASLARTLRELHGMRPAAPPAPTAATAPSPFDDDDYDDMPQDIDEFRLELARRIDAFVDSRKPEYADYDG